MPAEEQVEPQPWQSWGFSVKNEARGIPRLISAARFSWQGVKAAYYSEEAFRQEVWLACLLVPFAFYLADTPIELVLMVSSVLMLIIVELLNTAVETVVDRFGDEWNELSGKAKDVGSAAVLIAIFLLIFTWGAILVPRAV